MCLFHFAMNLRFLQNLLLMQQCKLGNLGHWVFCVVDVRFLWWRYWRREVVTGELEVTITMLLSVLLAFGGCCVKLWGYRWKVFAADINLFIEMTHGEGTSKTGSASRRRNFQVRLKNRNSAELVSCARLEASGHLLVTCNMLHRDWICLHTGLRRTRTRSTTAGARAHHMPASNREIIPIPNPTTFR